MSDDIDLNPSEELALERAWESLRGKTMSPKKQAFPKPVNKLLQHQVQKKPCKPGQNPSRDHCTPKQDPEGNKPAATGQSEPQKRTPVAVDGKKCLPSQELLDKIESQGSSGIATVSVLNHMAALASKQANPTRRSITLLNNFLGEVQKLRDKGQIEERHMWVINNTHSQLVGAVKAQIEANKTGEPQVAVEALEANTTIFQRMFTSVEERKQQAYKVIQDFYSNVGKPLQDLGEVINKNLEFFVDNGPAQLKLGLAFGAGVLSVARAMTIGRLLLPVRNFAGMLNVSARIGTLALKGMLTFVRYDMKGEEEYAWKDSDSEEFLATVNDTASLSVLQGIEWLIPSKGLMNFVYKNPRIQHLLPRDMRKDNPNKDLITKTLDDIDNFFAIPEDYIMALASRVSPNFAFEPFRPKSLTKQVKAVMTESQCRFLHDLCKVLHQDLEYLSAQKSSNEKFLHTFHLKSKRLALSRL